MRGRRSEPHHLTKIRTAFAIGMSQGPESRRDGTRMRPGPRLASACCRCRRRGEESRTGGSPSLPSWVGSTLPRDPIGPAGRCRRRGEKSRTGGSPSLPSWVGSALPRGPIWSAGPGQELQDSEGAADRREHGFLREEPEPNAETLLGLRVTRADLLGHAYRDPPSIHLYGPPLLITPGPRHRLAVIPAAALASPHDDYPASTDGRSGCSSCTGRWLQHAGRVRQRFHGAHLGRGRPARGRGLGGVT